MSDATLTTEQVRYAFNQISVWLPGVRDHDYGEAFDRWLAAHDREVAAKERERSAQIAEAVSPGRYDFEDYPVWGSYPNLTIADAIRESHS